MALSLEQKRVLQNLLVAKAKQATEQGNEVALIEFFILGDVARRALAGQWLTEARGLLQSAHDGVDGQAQQRKDKINADIAAIDTFPAGF